MKKSKEQPKREEKPLAGPAFTIGGGLPKPDAASDERAAREAVEALPDPARVNLMNRAVLGLGIGASLIAVLVIVGLFVVRFMETNPDSGRDWTVEMLATPQVVTERASGSGFLIEVNRELWLVTNLHVLEGAEEVDFLFPDPKTGTELFRVADRRINDFRVHKRLLDSLLDRRDSAYMDLAALNVEQFRDNLSKIGAMPLPVLRAVEVRTGQPAYALGHPASTFEFGDESKDQSSHTARHTLTAGLVSSVRQDPNRPIMVQTDAALNSGCSGGPLLSAAGEVLAVNTWRDVEVKGGAQVDAKEGMAFSLATDHVLEVIANGSTVRELRQGAAVRARLNTGTAPTLQGQSEETGWPTFSSLGTAFGRARGDQWNWTSRLILTTGADGKYAGTYATLTNAPTDVLILALPKLATIDLDIVEVTNGTGAVVGSDKDPSPGMVAEVRVDGAQHSGSIAVEVSTFVGGRGVPAEFVVLVFERPAAGSGPPTANSPPAVPPAVLTPPAPPPPTTQPLPAPGTPPSALPPVVPQTPPTQQTPQPGAPAPQLPTAPAGTPKATIVDVQDGMAKTVYASSLIGLREFDLRFLTNRAAREAFDELEQAFVDRTPNLVRDDADFARDIMRASLARSFLLPVTGSMTLVQSRPLFEALLQQVPKDTRVGVSIEVDPAWKQYLMLSAGGLVSKSADIKLEPAGQSDAYRHEQSTDTFRVSLDLPWNDDALRRLTQAIDIPYTLVVTYEDGSTDRMSGRIHVNPVAQVEQAYPFGVSVASIVDETHPWVKKIVDEINQRTDVKSAGAKIAGGGGSPQDRLESIYLVWQDLVARGLRYQNLTAADGLAQRCRLVHESISSKNANCLDGTVLLASFIEAMGIDSYLVLLPGHALVCADGGDQWIFIETTGLGAAPGRDPATSYDDAFAELRRRGKFFRSTEMDSLEGACGSAVGTVVQSIEGARPVLAAVRQMESEYDQNHTDPAWMTRFEQALNALAQQIMIVPVSLARQNGVRPVGAPPDLDQSFRIPTRR